ncbi:MAG TPA: hypothetical protein ENN69_08840, partial [Spirochaetia bacterium]|nr:hypothetical protein [Spirochaetia bacterium]
ILACLSLPSAAAQSANPQAGITADVAEKRKLLALSTLDYPVTPGDVYVLLYSTGAGDFSRTLTVPGDYQVNVYLFGTVDARGETALTFMRRVEEKVRRAYPQSKPSCLLESTGIFTVRLTGEVIISGEVECWGLTTLTDVLEGRTTPHSSIRRVTIESADGTATTYDPFLAVRFGERGQNPFVRPGDRVVVSKALRKVSVAGEVTRPGSYELLPKDELQEVIEKYADGFTALSDTSRIYITRTLGEEGGRGESFVVNRTDAVYKAFALQSLDQIRVPSREERLGFVTFEGAIRVAETTQGEPQALSGTLRYRLRGAEPLSAVVRLIQEMFSPVADLARAYIIRQGKTEPIPANIEALLSDYSPEKDVTLQPEDRVVIPLRQQFVTVSGAVFMPGRYPYVPNRTFRYYLGLAGGSDPQKNVGDSVVITDADEQAYSTDRIIQPDDKIFAEFNNGLYHFQQWGLVLGTAISFGALVVGILQLTR